MKKIPISNPTNFYHPPLLPMPDIPVLTHHGSYLAKRRHDVHTGVDLYCQANSTVYCVEEGEVVNIRYFTGKEVGTEFWNTTWAVEIESHTGVFSYGEILPVTMQLGDIIKSGQVIGNVLTVLKEYKGKPMSMLHFSIHRHGWQYLYKDQEDKSKESFFDLQLDPTLLLIQLKSKADQILK